MKRLLFSFLAIVLIVGLSDAVIYACGSKFLVSSKSSVGLFRIIARTEPTTILIYWKQNDETKDEDRWSPNATDLLEEVGHRVAVTLDADAFLAAARDGDFEVLMIKPFEEAQRLKEEIRALAPRSVMMPLLWVPTRAERNAAKREFDRVLTVPTTQEEFLVAINEAGKVR